jgi:hypothetical protein
VGPVPLLASAKAKPFFGWHPEADAFRACPCPEKNRPHVPTKRPDDYLQRFKMISPKLLKPRPPAVKTNREFRDTGPSRSLQNSLPRRNKSQTR